MGLAPSKTFGEASAAILSKSTVPPSGSQQVITFAGGCFWGIELAFQRVPGVVRTEVGYAQGHAENPTYEEVCSGTTGHTEVVQVVYDPAAISTEELLTVFWDLIDPTTLNRQGNDTGTQYRSGIYTSNAEQMEKAIASRDALQERLGVSVVTEVQPLRKYYRAENYHQQYLQKGGQCAAVGDLTPIRCYG